MPTINDAILSIRKSVQDFGDKDTTIGPPARLDQVEWMGKLLGWTWPKSYLQLLGKHDGVTVRHACILDFYSAFRSFVVNRDLWHELKYWPLAEDGCGDYWVMALGEEKDGDCPIYYLDHETDTGLIAPCGETSESLPSFIIQYMESIWVRGQDDED